MEALINPTEMYLKSVLEFEELAEAPLRARIAERVGHAPSTVTQTANRMLRQGLFYSVPGDRSLHLTTAGRRLALGVMRKHRLAECLLVTTIGLEWAWANDEAARWEHAMGDRATERIAELLGHPERSPYGNPIPSAADVERGSSPLPREPGVINALHFTFDSAPDEAACVVSLSESLQSDPELLQRCWDAGVVPGCTALIDRSGTGVQLTSVHEEDRSLELDHAQAAQLFVRVRGL